jgi:hypothetical protein
MLSLGLTIWPAALQAGPITYTIQSYSSLQSGDVLSGTITTDGNTGTLVAADITSWSYTIMKGTTTVDHQSGSASGVEASGLTATPTALTLPIPSLNVSEDFALQGSGLSGVFWIREGNAGFDLYEGDGPGEVVLWSSAAIFSPGLALPTAPGPWLIGQASVPEPSSLALVLPSSVCLAAAEWARRRRRGRTRETGSP